jgi:hypothetical protein
MGVPKKARLEKVILCGDQGVWEILQEGYDDGPWIINRILPFSGEAGLYWPNRDFSGNGYDEEHGIIVKATEGAMEEDYVVVDGVWERQT